MAHKSSVGGRGGKVSTRVEDQIRDPGNADIYYVESPGAQGVMIGSKVGLDMKARIQHVVQSGVFPDLDSENKLVRSAVHYYMEKVLGARMDKTFQNDLKVAGMHSRILASKMRGLQVAKFVETTASTINELCAHNLRDEAVRVWRDVNAMMWGMNEPYRTLYRSAFNGSSYATWVIVREELGLKVTKHLQTDGVDAAVAEMEAVEAGRK